MLAVLAGVGLTKINNKNVIALITTVAILLPITNAIYLNANKETDKQPVAQNLAAEIDRIPDGSAVVTHTGGFESMALWWRMSEGKDLVPVYFIAKEKEDSRIYQNYCDWVGKKWGIEGENTQEQVKELLEEQDREVWVLIPLVKEWEGVIEWEAVPGFERYGKVTGVNTDVEVHRNS